MTRVLPGFADRAASRNNERAVKLRSGFLAGVVPESECLNRDGQPIGAEYDEYARVPTVEERDVPLPELFAHVAQEPLPRYWSSIGSGCVVIGAPGNYLELAHGEMRWSEDGRNWVTVLTPDRVELARELFTAEANFERKRLARMEAGE